jgi:O-succinylbenzoic acid--CoA ligase
MAASDPDGPAVQGSSAIWTHRELDRVVDALASGLAEAGVGHSSRVAALMEDDAPAVALLHALRRLGAVLVPLDRRAARPEAIVRLAHAEASVLVHDRPQAESAAALAEAMSVGTFAVGPLLEHRVSGHPPARPGIVEEGAAATIVFTSGTTGRPRGAILSHAAHAASADAWAAVLHPRPTDRWLACLPLYHVAGLAIIIRAARWGVPMEVMRRFDAGTVAERLVAGVSHLSLVSTQLRSVLEAWSGRDAPASLRALLLGGGPISLDLVQRARAEGLPILTTYGMTETGSGVAVGGADAATLADPMALRPLPGVGVRIGAPDRAGVGRIEVRGAMVFSGYVGHPRATGDWSQDGWWRTGDLGRIDDDGLLRIVDRRDDLIVSGGENVAPAEVEAILLEHPAVAAAAVVGRPDPTWGAVPVAFVVVRDDTQVEDAGLERHCRDRLASYKVPRAFQRVADLPRDALGKVRRQVLRDALEEGLR